MKVLFGFLEVAAVFFGVFSFIAVPGTAAIACFVFALYMNKLRHEAASKDW